MFKNFNLASILSIIIIGLFVGVVFVYADWSAPKLSPPNCETNPADTDYDPACEAPINVSINSQIKSGTLQVNGFRNIGNAIFDGDVTINGALYGVKAVASTGENISWVRPGGDNFSDIACIANSWVLITDDTITVPAGVDSVTADVGDDTRIVRRSITCISAYDMGQKQVRVENLDSGGPPCEDISSNDANNSARCTLIIPESDYKTPTNIRISTWLRINNCSNLCNSRFSGEFDDDSNGIRVSYPEMREIRFINN